MIVPEYWAEARQQIKRKGRNVIVRRFGWSDLSTEAAQLHADTRAREAMDALVAGKVVPRRERRTSYGVEGVPIREQIVSRHDDEVITRNSYGALCLNTPDVLFADIDFETPPQGCVIPLLGGVAIAAILFAVGMNLWNWLAGMLMAVVGTWLVNRIVLFFKRRAFSVDGGAQSRAVARVQAFHASHPDWILRLYRTPAGLRVLVMHAVFSANDPQVATFFTAIKADELYARMCKLQQCFRARLTAKPWRIGVRSRIKPPIAAWAPEQANRPDRLAWISDYESRARGFAACHYLSTFGDEWNNHPKAARVRDLHDGYSNANSKLPLG